MVLLIPTLAIVFCLTISGLVNARSRMGSPHVVTHREKDKLWLSSREEEPSISRNIDEVFRSRHAYNQQEQRAYELTNAARKTGRYCGSTWYPATTELAWDDQLANAARQHAYDMRNQNYYSHTSLDGRGFGTRITNAGYRCCTAAENIHQDRDADSAVQGWLNSPGHCANIMSGNYRDIGIGYASGGSFGAYWVQNFGKSCSMFKCLFVPIKFQIVDFSFFYSNINFNHDSDKYITNIVTST